LVEGSYNIIVEYIEEGCTGSSSVMINLTTEPTASFDVDNATICIGESVNLVYTGSQLSSQMLNWTSGGETVVQGINMNEYSTTFNSDGTFEIELLVENGDCQSETISQSITVEPLLVFDPIDCDESLDEIVFSWSVVDCATSFEVFIDGVSQGVQSETSYTVADLTEGQEVAIEVIAVSGCACGNVMQTRMCEARACPTIDITLSATQQEFCIGDDLLPIQIIDEVVGSIEMGTITWTGTEVDANGLFDPSAAGIGSHTIEYTYLESEGCDYTSSIIFDIYDIPEVDFTLGEINCYDQTTTMVELLPSGGSGTYELLLNGEISDLSVEVAIGSYDVVVTDDNMCSAMTSFIVSAVAEPSPSISGNVDLILGESGEYSIDPLVFNGQTINSIIWTANGIEICNAPDCFSITQTPNEDTEYVVIIHFNEGCSVMASNLVTVTEIIEEPISIVEIPNVISPNNDGNNDEWVIFSNDADVLVNSIKIYDRWGNKVFTVDNQFVAKDNTITWDGKFKNKALQPGVYVYFIDFVQEGSAKTRSGDITIVN
ncbi:MAG: gliding motility-associated C-terminal domain-containing protein, partial [Saprospiraceae bacterium]